MEGICFSCAAGRGARIPMDHRPTLFMGRCGLCHIHTEITPIRDFGHTASLLTDLSDRPTGLPSPLHHFTTSHFHYFTASPTWLDQKVRGAGRRIGLHIKKRIRQLKANNTWIYTQTKKATDTLPPSTPSPERPWAITP